MDIQLKNELLAATGEGPLGRTPLVVNEANLNNELIFEQQIAIYNASQWHKIIVHDIDKLDRDFILKTLTAAVYPLDLIPVFYQVEDNNASFLVRNCGNAIIKLLKEKLRVNNPLDPHKQFKISLVIAFSSTNELRINVQDNIVTVLNKRYNAATKTLNLDSFYKDPDLTEFCVLSQPKILYYILHLSKSLQPNNIILSNNEIRLLSSLQVLRGSNVSVLDLRNNLISEIAELKNLQGLPITELLLEGNPCCDNHNEASYVESVRMHCPKLEKLDSHPMPQMGFPVTRTNFLCDPNGLDLANQFVLHYFTLIDCQNRAVLESLYHKDAMFTMTASYLDGQPSTPTANLKKYMVISRNLKMLADISRVMQFLHIGNKNIVKVLCGMPKTEHDTISFTFDLLQYTEKYAVMMVTGAFKELPEIPEEPERVLGFTRTFVLIACRDGEYQIINEQLHISNATADQQARAFKYHKVSKVILLQLPPAQSCEQKQKLEEALNMISTMNIEWSKKCLKEVNYDLKEALKLFVELYKNDKIPDEAFKK